MVDNYASLTPYNYSFNNPIVHNDPNGADPFDDRWSDWLKKQMVPWMDDHGGGDGSQGGSSLSGDNISGTSSNYYNGEYIGPESQWPVQGLLALAQTGNQSAMQQLGSRFGYQWNKFGGDEVLRDEWLALGGDPSIKADHYFTGGWEYNEPQGDPIIFISFGTVPYKFDKEDYFKKMQASLIANGFSKSIKVKEYNMTDKLIAWWNNSPNSTISFSSYQNGFPIEAGGFSELNNPNSITIYAGLSSTSIANIYSTSNYVQATLHEIGHAFFGFSHDQDGNATGISATAPSVMDYRFAYDEGQGFNTTEKQVVSKSIWSNH